LPVSRAEDSFPFETPFLFEIIVVPINTYNIDFIVEISLNHQGTVKFEPESIRVL